MRWSRRVGVSHGRCMRDMNPWPRSRHQFDVTTWLGWGKQVLGHDMNFMSRQGATWCSHDRRMAEPVGSR